MTAVSPLTIARVQKESFSAAAESAKLVEGRDIGAVVTFTGVCRSEGGALAALEIEHYPGMAEAEIARILTEAAARWPIEAALVVHRYGLITPGEPIVLVVTASAHREAAFASASFLMDFLKTEAPFWKKQHLAPGAGEPLRAALNEGWVKAKAEDDVAASRWRS